METLRALTLNLWGEQPPLERRLELVVEACRELRPDVIGLQEVRVVPRPEAPSPATSPIANTAETIARELGFAVVFVPATPWGGGDEGLALLSRLPITRQGHLELPHATPTERRVILGAALATPHGETSVFTTHLNYRLAEGDKRADQVEVADAFTQTFAAGSSLPRLLMGDFNAVPESDEIRFLRGLHSHRGRRTYWQDAWAHHHPDERGYTWARRNPYTARLGWLEPDRRLDYVFVSPMRRDGSGSVREARIVLDQPAADGVWGSDHFGVLAEVQLAPRAS